VQAIRQHEFGPPEVLRLEDLPELRAGPGEVRIAVEAAGVHLLDTTIRQGVGGGPFPLPALPMTPGREVAGTVDEVGSGVSSTWCGQRVVAHLGQASGGYASQAVVPVAALREIPDDLASDAAVALVGTGRTAMAVLDHAPLAAGDVVVVTGAAGGLGSLLVQSGHNAGATVVGLAGGRAKVEQVAALGADVAVDYDAPGWTDVARERLGGATATIVLDGVGGERGRGAFDLLGPGGRIVLFGYSSGDVTPFTSADLAARALSASWSIGPAMMRRFGSLEPLERMALGEAAAGRWRPVVTRFALADAAAAHRAVVARQTVGKTVLVPGA
jgi:NADPH2:quinone reductase